MKAIPRLHITKLVFFYFFVTMSTTRGFTSSNGRRMQPENQFDSASPTPVTLLPSNSPTVPTVLFDTTKSKSPTTQPITPTKTPINTNSPVETQALTPKPTKITAEATTQSPTKFYILPTTYNSPTDVLLNETRASSSNGMDGISSKSSPDHFWFFSLTALSMLVILSIGMLIRQLQKRRQRSSTAADGLEDVPLPPIIITYQSDSSHDESKISTTLHSQVAGDDENTNSYYSRNNASPFNYNDDISIDEFTYQNTEKGDDDHQSIAFSMDGQSCM